jgi:hypothetical protein
MKYTILIIIVLLSTFVSAECFTYQNSPLFCNDLNLDQARQECIVFPDCDPPTHIVTTSCETTTTCQQQTGLPVISQQQKEENLPVVEDKQEEVKEGAPAFLWIILAIIALTVAGYFAVTRGLISGLFKKDDIPESSEEGIWRALSPFNSSPVTIKRIGAIKRKHKKKLHSHEIKAFLLESGLGIPEKENDLFTQLNRVNRAYEKKKQHLANKLTVEEKRIFQNLEEVVNLSKKKAEKITFNAMQKEIKEDASEILQELRKIAGGN